VKYFTLLFLAIVAYGQQERVAIIQTLDDRDSISFSDLAYLTDKLRETAVNVLPSQRYGIMTTESIVAFLGSQERAIKACKEASCLAELGRKVSADYVAQAHLGRFDKNLTIKTELYNSKSGNLMGSFTGSSKSISGLLNIIDEKAPDLFKRMLGPSSSGAISPPSFTGGISGVQTTGKDYEFDGGKAYLANINTDPEGAFLSFDGAPDSRCVRTPCKVVLTEGNVRIVAALERYERTDTTVLINRNNQIINIRLKANFGVLEINPAYLDGIGRNESWNLTINGKMLSSMENKLSSGKYSVELSHRCYESISFNVGINKDRREIFDMTGYIKLKKGGLVLSAEKEGNPVSEPVFVNGVRVGETPFSGAVPICAEIGIGNSKNRVDVKIVYNQTVKHKHQMLASSASGNAILNGVLTDSRDGKRYKTVKIGNQVWMAENLSYNANGSKCYNYQENACQIYGRLYDWAMAKKVCPKGWHLPSDAEWNVLMKSVNPACSPMDNCVNAGKFLKAKFGWNENGNGTDTFGFSALPGGGSDFEDSFFNAGDNGVWWSSNESENNNYYANSREMYYIYDFVNYNDYDKRLFFSVRCLQNK